MTLKRKLGIAAVLVVVVVTVVLIARDNEPVIAAKFLRYEYGVNAAVHIQITNLSRSAVFYGVGAIPSIYSSSPAPMPPSGFLQAHQELQVMAPMPDGSSNIGIVYFRAHGALYRRLAPALETLGISIRTDTPRSLFIALPPPKTPLP